jgi:hemoglobin-like flavoprotein
MALDIELLRENFNLVLEKSPNLTTRLYEILFERYPQVKPLFARRSPAAHERMVTQALIAVVNNLEDTKWLHDTLFALGARHVNYGLTDEMYGWAGSALLLALAEASGDAWTPRVEDAWVQAYDIIVQMMLEGAHSVSRLSNEMRLSA